MSRLFKDKVLQTSLRLSLQQQTLYQVYDVYAGQNKVCQKESIYYFHQFAYNSQLSDKDKIKFKEFCNEEKKGSRLVDHFDRETVDDVFRLSLKQQTGVSLKYMLDFGQTPREQQLIYSAKFLQNELPVRLAHRVAELDSLPYGLSSVDQVQKVRNWYMESFKELRDSKRIQQADDEREFTEILRRIYQRHNAVIVTMAKGVAQLRSQMNINNLTDFQDLHQFLDGFYLSRTGVRMLIGQHLALHEPPKKNYIGLINTHTSPVEVAHQAVTDARDVCVQEYGDAPAVQVFGDEHLRFSYVPAYLHWMLFEILKNSLKAVHDRFDYSEDVQAPVRVIVAQGDEDITIKVSDEGGGIPRSGVSKIFTYLYSTSKIQNFDQLTDEAPTQVNSELNQSLVAGYGYGLPISRIIAKYFGGDIQIISMEGYGTDTYLHLNRLGNSQEPLP